MSSNKKTKQKFLSASSAPPRLGLPSVGEGKEIYYSGGHSPARLCARVLISTLLILLTSAAYAQTAAETEALLETNTITCEQAIFFTLASAMDSPPQRTELFAYAREHGWIRANMESTSLITISDLSLLIMKAFDIKGGLMYSITGSRRYAFREMKYRGYITGRVYPNQKVSGELLLQILDEITDGQEDEQ